MDKGRPLTHKQLYDKARYQARKVKEPTGPADPIEMLSDIDRAYIAGLVDGEGCLRIGRVGGPKPSRKAYYYPIFLLGMSDEAVILWLRGKLSSGTVKLNNHTALRRNPRWKPQWQVRLYGKRTQTLCKVLLPYLKVKQAQARVVLEFPCENRMGPGSRLPQDVKEIRQHFYDVMSNLNKRGPE